jgi:hypothetical protein
MLVRRLDNDGQPCFGHGVSDFVTGADAVVVLVSLAVRLTLGEWFLDTSLGVAWWKQEDGQKQILGTRPADEAFSRSELVRVVLGVVGVSAIQQLQFFLDHSTREARVAIEILTIYGVPRKVQVRASI